MTDKPMTVEEKIRCIVEKTGRLGSFRITYNDHTHYYRTVEEDFSYEEDHVAGEGFINLEDYNKCLEENILWTVQWYPRNPVGFYVTYGSTLDNAAQRMFIISNEEAVDEQEGKECKLSDLIALPYPYESLIAREKYVDSLRESLSGITSCMTGEEEDE